MRKSTILCAAAALLLGAAFALAQGRRDEARGPYRAVVTVKLKSGMGRAKDKFLEMPELTEAINNLAAQGYELHSLTPWTDERFIVVGKKR